MKQNKWIISLVLIFAIFSCIALTFGYFIANVTVNGNISDITGTVDYVSADITLTNITPYVNITKGFPMTEADAEEIVTPYNFTITNNSLTRGAAVEIILETKSSTNTIPDRLIDAKIEAKSGVLTNTNVYTSVTATQTGYQSAYKLWEGTINPGSKNFSLLLWIDETGDNNGGANDVQNKEWYGKIVVKAVDAEPIPVDPSGANEPKLVTNLIPVVYDETSSKWKMSATTPGEWYDYSEQKWANAVTVTSAKRGTYSEGDTIEMEDILGMWVWIPRYEYKYTNLGESYAGGTAELPGGIDINFISGTSTTETSGYIIHPAFRNASSGYTNNAGTFSAYQIGGWDSELTGFWMGKFETASLALANTYDQTSYKNITDTDPIVKPNVIRRYQAVYYQYSTAQNIGTYHGISTLDTHMGKNSEWGAVAYLSQSAYGKYGNSDYSGANREVYMNNSEDFYTGRSMGAPASDNGSTSSAGTYEYNVSQNGTGASTTGNIYGIYDMAGGSSEYVMGWLSTASSNFGYRNNYGTDTNDAGFSSAPSSHKYWDEYTTGEATTACGGGICYGHGLSETRGWYGDRESVVLSTSYPWFDRGGYYSNSSGESNGGVFYCVEIYGSYDGNGSRAVLV